jgi:hypothetical protein
LLIKNLLPSYKRCLEADVVAELFVGNGCFSDSTILALSKYATILTGPCCNITVLNVSAPIEDKIYGMDTFYDEL